MRTLAEIVPLRTAACREAVDAVALIAAGEPGVDPAAGAHVVTCLRCQAEVAAYRRVLLIMKAMRQDRMVPPAGALEGAVGALHAADPEEGWSVAASAALSSLSGGLAGGLPGVAAGGAPAWAVRAAYVGGITAATAASAAGVLVWFSRRRPGLLPAS